MLLTKVKGTIAVLLVLAMATLGAGALISRGGTAEPSRAPADEQGPADEGDLHARVVELKRQLRQMQGKLARLEQDTLARQDGRNGLDASLAGRFKYRVPFETGLTETREGGRIEILEVWGTRPRIEVGGQYVVRGRYVLPHGERGKLYFYETAEGAWGQGPTATMDLQTASLDREKGEFTLLHGMAGPGYFHLYLASPDRYSRYFANVYFGTGSNVRKKPW